MCEKESIPNIYDTLADLYKFMAGECAGLPDRTAIRQIYMVRDKIHISTDVGLWEFDPREKVISNLVLY